MANWLLVWVKCDAMLQLHSTLEYSYSLGLLKWGMFLLKARENSSALQQQWAGQWWNVFKVWGCLNWSNLTGCLGPIAFWKSSALGWECTEWFGLPLCVGLLAFGCCRTLLLSSVILWSSLHLVWTPLCFVLSRRAFPILPALEITC